LPDDARQDRVADISGKPGDGAEADTLRRAIAPPRTPLNEIPATHLDGQGVMRAAAQFLEARDLGDIAKAVDFAIIAHGKGKPRHDGKPYHTHVLAVGEKLANLGLDPATIIAGILHDTVEDKVTEADTVLDMFGEEVSRIVEGVTKIAKLVKSNRDQPDLLSSHSNKAKGDLEAWDEANETAAQRKQRLDQQERRHSTQASNFQKLIMATARDVRVLLVKLADRLHNMETIEGHSANKNKTPEQNLAKRHQIARETLELYAPLARRIGLYEVATDLEDRAFRELQPETYAGIVQRLAILRERYDKTITSFESSIIALASCHGVDAQVSYREKRPYSIHQKMMRKATSFDSISDIYAYRIIVKDRADCYKMLGILHQRWRCNSDKFTDYFSAPKSNGYKALHTTLIGNSQHTVEVQLRDEQSHAEAERGIAAHWQYKNATYGLDIEGARAANMDPEATLQELLALVRDGGQPEELVDLTRFALHQDEVFVLTPKGQVVSLPKGAMPLDLAYAISPEIGDRAVGVRINGQEVPLRTLLRNADRVQIITSQVEAIHPGWEGMVTTRRAKLAIAKTRERHNRLRIETTGREMLWRELRMVGKDPADVDLAEMAKFNMRETESDLLYDIGDRRNLTAAEAVQRAFPNLAPSLAPLPASTPSVGLNTDAHSLVLFKDATSAVGAVLARCCEPLPGDRIIGIHQPGGVIETHLINCQELEKFDNDPSRWVDLTWNMNTVMGLVAVATLRVTASNKPGVLALLCKTVAEEAGNIVNVSTPRRDRDYTDILLDVEVKDSKHASQILNSLRILTPVAAAERVKGVNHDA